MARLYGGGARRNRTADLLHLTELWAQAAHPRALLLPGASPIRSPVTSSDLAKDAAGAVQRPGSRALLVVEEPVAWVADVLPVRRTAVEGPLDCRLQMLKAFGVVDPVRSPLPRKPLRWRAIGSAGLQSCCGREWSFACFDLNRDLRYGLRLDELPPQLRATAENLDSVFARCPVLKEPATVFRATGYREHLPLYDSGRRFRSFEFWVKHGIRVCAGAVPEAREEAGDTGAATSRWVLSLQHGHVGKRR
jgi:hypothetical protein